MICFHIATQYERFSANLNTINFDILYVQIAIFAHSFLWFSFKCYLGVVMVQNTIGPM